MMVESETKSTQEENGENTRTAKEEEEVLMHAPTENAVSFKAPFFPLPLHSDATALRSSTPKNVIFRIGSRTAADPML